MSTIWIIAYSVQWLVLTSLMFLIFRLMKLIGKYIAQVENIQTNKENIIGPPLGITAPALNDDLNISLKHKSYLLLFLSTGCSYCKGIVNELSKIALKDENILVLVKIEDVAVFEEYKDVLSRNNIRCEPLAEQVFNDYIIKGFPFAINIKNGKIASKGPAPSVQAINEVKKIA